MLAEPEAKLAVGVKVAVRVRPVPLIALKVPPVVTMSASTKPTGASLNVKVIVAVSPALTALALLVRSRAQWGLLGCSHAQRDVFEQTLIHAAVAAAQ